MLDRDALGIELARIRAVDGTAEVNRIFFRSIALRHFVGPITPQPLYASAAGSGGSRFAPPQAEIRTLYVAGEHETAYREGNQVYFQTIRKPPTDPEKIPRPGEVAIIGIRVASKALVDLRLGPIRDRLGTTEAELRSAWKTVRDAPPQRLGEAAFDHGGFDGILYASTQHPGGTCLVLFPDRLAVGSVVHYRTTIDVIPDARWSR